MTVFRIVSGLGFLAIAGFIAFDLHRTLGGWAEVGGFLRTEWRNVRTFTKSPLRTIDRALYLITITLFAILAVTGFSSTLLFGEHLTGALLIIHVTVAPLFAVSLSGLAVLWANRMRIDILPSEGTQPGGWFRVKAIFWSVLVLALPLMLSIILGLFPLFGTDGEEILISVHGYSALLLCCLVLLQIFVVLTDPELTTERLKKEEKQ